MKRALPQEKYLTDKMDHLLQEHGIPAISVAVSDDKQLLLDIACGRHMTGSSRPASKDQLMHLGSNAKAIVATLAAALIEKGFLNWDTPLEQMLGSWEVAPELRNITIVDLLCHRSGLASFTDDSEFTQYDILKDDHVPSCHEFCRWLVARPPRLPAGEINYSNAGYSVAACALEQVSGQNWQQLLTHYIGRRLDIKFKFSVPAMGDSLNQPWGHAEINGKLTAINPYNLWFTIPELLNPAGNISMTTGDYHKFLRLHIGAKQTAPPLLSDESIAMLHTPADEHSDPQVACGWSVQKYKDYTIHGHQGSEGTFMSVVIIIPQAKLAISTHSNAATPAAQSVCIELAKNILEIAIG